MLNRIVPVRNIMTLAAAGESLLHRSPGEPGMGLVVGKTGYGKTKSVTWYMGQCNAVYVRATENWTPSSMCEVILEGLRRKPQLGAARMQKSITEALALSRRPLIVDEADYVVADKRLTNTLRDIHDMSSVPVILVGMDGIIEALSDNPQLLRRIREEVHFRALEFDDTIKVAAALCEVTVREDLLQRIHQTTAGTIGNIIISLGRVERQAKAMQLASIGLAEWGKGDTFTSAHSTPPAPPISPVRN